MAAVVEDIQNFGFIGELSLNADIRACSGILPMAIEAKNRGITNLIVPKENIREASLVKGINIFGFEKLTEVISNILQASCLLLLLIHAWHRQHNC